MSEYFTLTGEQRALVRQVRDEWMKIGIDNMPVDPTKVRQILERLYAAADKPAPESIVFLDSPFQISMAIAKLRLEGEPVHQQVSDLVSEQVHEHMRKGIVEHIDRQTIELFSGRTGFERFAVYTVLVKGGINDIREQVSETASGRFGGSRAWPLGCDYGQFDVSLAWLDYVGRLGIDVSKLAPFFDLAKACGWAVLFWNWAFVSAKPEYIRRDERGRLHCENGAAVRYPDGFSVFAIHGVRVPEKIAVSPKSITVPEIEFEDNAEVRRVMIQRYGPERYLMDSGAEQIHHDDFGVLYRKHLPGDESLVMVKVVNATPEPDGSFKDYFLRVPPTMERARQAVAWTCGKAEDDYAPAVQT
jgi:hypothetical protein